MSTDYTSTATVTVSVNGKDAENKLSQLRQRAEDLRNAIAKAGAEGDKVNLEKHRTELRKTTKEIRLMESSTAEVERVMRNLSRATPRELQRSLTQLNRELKNMERGTAAWDAQTKKIRQVRAELDSVNASLREHEGWFSRINRKLNDWGVTITAALASLTGLIMSARSAVQTYVDMDTAMANTRKFTGMTEDEVARLNEEFKKMDTRSSREQLNEMAQAAGRLGKNSVEDVMGFVRAADVIGVAMDELGDDAPQIIAQLAGIFNLEPELGTERSMLAVGSSVNTLSQNCAASAPNLVDFASRLGAIASQTGMTIDEMLAFGAVLDANRVSVEKSATAIQTVLSKMMADPADFARKAGMPVDEFTEKIKRSSTEGLMMFIEHLNQLDKMDVAGVLAELKVQDSGVIATFNTLAGKLGDVKTQLEASKKAFDEATSATEEFNVQNNTVEAQLQKAKNRFGELAAELGQRLMPVMSYAISSMSAMVRMLNSIIRFATEYGTTLVVVTSAIAAYTAAVKFAIVYDKIEAGLIMLKVAWKKTLAAAILLVRGAYYALTGHIRTATKAMEIFNTVTKMNPLGLLLSLVTALGVGMYTLSKRTNEAKDKIDELSNQMGKLDDQGVKEMQTLDELFGKLEGAAKGTETYKDAKEQIISQYGTYLEGLVNEKGEITDLAEAYSRLSREVEKSAKIRQINQIKEKIENEKLANVSETLDVMMNELLEAGYSRKDAYSIVTDVQLNIMTGQKMRPETVDALTKNIYSDLIDDAFSVGAKNKENLLSIWGNLKEEVKYADSMIADANKRAREIDEFYGVSDAQLTDALKSVTTAIDTGTRTAVIISDGKMVAKSGLADYELSYYQDAYAKELRHRTGQLPPEMEGVVVTARKNEPITDGGDRGGSSTTTSPVSDALRQEYDRSIAEAKIAYLRGATGYRQYEAQIYSIKKEYLQKQLENNELEAADRAKLEAELAQLRKDRLDQELEMSRADLELEHQAHQQKLKEQYADGLISDASYREQSFRAELDYLEKLKIAWGLNSEEISKIDKQIEEKELAEKLRKKEEYENRLADIEREYMGMTQSQKDAAYQQDLADLDAVYQEKLAAAGENAQLRLEIEEMYLKAVSALRAKYNQGEDGEPASGWVAELNNFINSDQFKNFQKGFSTVNSALGSLFSSYSQLVQAELDIQTNAINERYDKEVEAAQGNSTKISQIERRREAEIAQAKNAASKKQFAMQVIQALAQTAQNIISAVGAGMQFGLAAPYMVPLLVGIATATGAVQIAALKKQQQAAASQGYQSGGFTRPGAPDEPAGIVHAGEWVASQRLLANPTARSMINALDYAQRTNTIGSIRMTDIATVRPSASATHSVATSSQQTSDSLQLLQDTLILLNTRLNQPFVTINTVEGDNGIKKAQDEYNRLIRNKSPKWKS